ncbi:MAG: hypothetical protein JNK05_05170 [Myxococcales bacterium]|nr:hypothetical protein [Myxococcales bacterium]
MRIASIVCASLVVAACTSVPSRANDGSTDSAVADSATDDRMSPPADVPSIDGAQSSDTGVANDVVSTPDSSTTGDTGVVTDTGVSSDTGVVADTGAMCPPGQARCGGACVDTRTSRDHCGACDSPCVNPANGVAMCSSGMCMRTCNAGFDNCDGIASNGCEASLSSTAHCGRCGMACSGATPMCDSRTGTCVGSCMAPATLCGTSCVDTSTNVMHCGGCSRPCSLPNATARCVAGGCTIDRCLPGFANCDGVVSNGCEVNTTNNASNCGGCGTRCSLPNALAACSGSVCTVASCNTNFGNCDGNDANGCETDLTRSPANCGRCGTNCGAAGACIAGTGGTASCVSCMVTSCGTYCANTNTDTANCGACGYRCPPHVAGAAVCTAGRCYVGFACDPKYADCDGSSANGYEINTDTSNANCGSCGNVCGAGTRCCNGVCRSTTMSCFPCA